MVKALPAGALCLLLVGSAVLPAANAPVPTAPAAQADQTQELDEVIVEGSRVRRRRPSWDEYQQPFNFLARLVGQYVIGGSVDLRGAGRPEDLREVAGQAQCIGFGSAPGVLCELSVRWPESRGANGEDIPGGVSTLDPAVLLLGFEPDVPGISHVLLDNTGVADTAVGAMTSASTMLSRSSCVGIAGVCERTVRITAEPDLDTVRMNIDFAIDQQKSVGFAFVMRRVPDSGAVVYGRKQPRQSSK